MRLGQSTTSSPDLAALIAALIGLAAFAILPWVAFGLRDRFDESYSGAGMLLSLGDLTDDVAPESLALLDLTVDEMDTLLLLPIAALLLAAAAAAIGVIVQPRYLKLLRHAVMVSGLLTVLLVVVWAFASDFAAYVQIGFWLVMAVGVFLVLQALIPRETFSIAEVTRVNENPLTPAPFGIEPTMTFSMPTPAGFSAARPMGTIRPALAWLIDMRSGERYPVYTGGTSIGRLQSNDIVLNDLKVSREHALIQEDQGTFTLYDRASVHGTIVNDHRLTGPVKLKNRSQIKVGDVVLQFIQLEAEGL